MNDSIAEIAYMSGDSADSDIRAYPGFDGIPHRSPGPGAIYKEDDPEYKRPNPGGQVHCHVFDLSDPEQLLDYEKLASCVYTKQQAGAALLCQVERRFIAEIQTWKVYYEWIELFTFDPRGRGPHQYDPMSLKPLRRSG